MGLVFLREEDYFLQLLLTKSQKKKTQEENKKPYPFTQIVILSPMSMHYNTKGFGSLLLKGGRLSCIFSH